MVYQPFFNYISSIVDITKEEFDLIKTFFRPYHLPKKEFLLKKGEVCTQGAFVLKGAMRKYYIHNDGNEEIFTLQFAIENWWVAELESFFTKSDNQCYIQAIEDCELLIFTLEDHQKACELSPAYKKMFDIISANKSYAYEKRLISLTTSSAEEKYYTFAEKYPGFIQRFPQHMIASYLGIKPETLSRLRRKAT